MIVIIVYSTWMVVKKIIITLVNLVLAMLSYSFKNFFNFFEALNTVFTSAVVVVIGIILPTLYNGDLDADNPDLLNHVNRVAYYWESTSLFMAMSVYCLCFRLLKLPQFSLIANMPFATLIQGKKDILNILIIISVFTTSNALAAYIVFCPTSASFTNLSQSIFTLLKIYLGDFSPVGEMYSAAPGFTTFYLLLTMTLYTIFLTQMFLGIIVGHFETEWNLVNEMKGSNQESFNVA